MPTLDSVTDKLGDLNFPMTPGEDEMGMRIGECLTGLNTRVPTAGYTTQQLLFSVCRIRNGSVMEGETPQVFIYPII